MGILYLKGNYTGRFFGKMTSVAVDELYLMQQNPMLRLVMFKSMKMFNALLITRWKAETFIPFVANSKQEALHIIRKERQKELLFRGIRWPGFEKIQP